MKLLLAKQISVLEDTLLAFRLPAFTPKLKVKERHHTHPNMAMAP